MYKRVTLLLTISGGAFTKTRQFNPEHLYTVDHASYPSFDEVIVVCTDRQPLHSFYQFIGKIVKTDLLLPVRWTRQIEFLWRVGKRVVGF